MLQLGRHFTLVVTSALVLLSARQCTASIGWGKGALKPTPDPENKGYTPPPYLRDHFYGISNTSPILRGTRRIRNAVVATKELGRWFASAEKKYDKERSLSGDSRCATPTRNWTERAQESLKDRRLGKLDISCMARFDYNNDEAIYGQNLFRRVSDIWRDASWTAINESNNADLRRNWTRSGSFPMARWERIQEEQICEMEREAALKRNNKWYLLADVESAPVNKFVEKWERRRIEEYVTVDLSATLPVFVNGTDYKMRAYSTLQMLWGDRADLATHYDMNTTELVPLKVAVQRNAINVGQARDALLASNLAILILPLTLSFIPFALIADVNLITEFVYILFTDVLSALPLIVKGVEVYKIGTTPSIFGQTWVVGDNKLKFAEAWIVACRPRRSYRGPGIILMCVGVAAILTGFLIEFLARRYMRRQYAQGLNPEPFGPLFLNLNPYVALASAAAVGVPTTTRELNDPLRPDFAADLTAPPPVDVGPEFRAEEANNGIAQRFYRRIVRRRYSHGPGLRQEVVEVDESGRRLPDDPSRDPRHLSYSKDG